MTLVAISSEVNSSSKFPTSKVPVKTGIKGASNFLASKASKSNPWKKGWALISSKPLLTPSLLSCFLINNFVIKSLALSDKVILLGNHRTFHLYIQNYQ